VHLQQDRHMATNGGVPQDEHGEAGVRRLLDEIERLTAGPIPVVLTAIDAADLSDRSRWTILRRIESGSLRGWKLGRTYFVLRSDVMAPAPTTAPVTSPTLDGAPIVTLSSDAEEAA
jgi:hypothetical protein